MTLPGVSFQTNELLPEQKTHQITLMMLPLQHVNHLENFADNLGEGWFDPIGKQVKLQFHIVTLFSNTKLDRLWLAEPSGTEKFALSPTNAASPVIAKNHSQLAWAAQSRFVVDELIKLSEGMANYATLELLAEVGGKLEKIGVVHTGVESKSTSQEAGNLEVIATMALPTREVSQNPPTVKNSNLPPLEGIFHQVKSVNRLFLLTVVLPTLISIIYFGLIASDVYISESRFVVRSPEHQASTGLGALFQGTGFSRSQDDTYTIHDYIFSRDALKKLDDALAVGKAFSSKDIDMFSRFAGLGWDNSFEALNRYYQKHVKVDFDNQSSISTLSVSAYTATDAQQINEKLLDISESLVNQLNERGRQDMIRFATAEVATAENKAKAASLAVSNYRNLKGVFDPEKQSALQLQQVSKLQDELMATKIQLAQTRTLTRDSPQIPALQRQLETLQSEINSETAKVAGGDRSLANKSTQYEALMLERSFAEKQLAAALASLELARNEAQRKQLYLERVVQPSKPDVAVEPRRIRNVFATVVLGLIAWGILTMLLAGVREHQD